MTTPHPEDWKPEPIPGDVIAAHDQWCSSLREMVMLLIDHGKECEYGSRGYYCAGSDLAKVIMSASKRDLCAMLMISIGRLAEQESYVKGIEGLD